MDDAVHCSAERCFKLRNSGRNFVPSFLSDGFRFDRDNLVEEVRGSERAGGVWFYLRHQSSDYCSSIPCTVSKHTIEPCPF